MADARRAVAIGWTRSPRSHYAACVLRALALIVLFVACDPGVRLGAPCEYDGDCPSSLVCGLGRCRPECRRNVDCRLGAACVLSGDPPIGSCALPDDPVCPALACASGLVCVQGVCLNGCTDRSSCAEGNLCTDTTLGVRACIDPRDRGTDAALEDGGVGGSDGGEGCTGAACDPVISLALASRRACVVRQSGSVWCWGEDTAGETSGLPSGAEECRGTRCRTRPTRIALVDGALAQEVVVGDGFACARTSTGRVQCWGADPNGELGRPEAGPAPGWVRNASGTYLEGVRSIAAGRNHVLALLSGGELVGWGSNGSGELHTEMPSAVPAAQPIGRLTWTAIDGGEQFTCGIRAKDPYTALSCWGQNENGQLGRGTIDTPMTSATEAPVSVPKGTYTAIAAGAEQACALEASGSLICWGLDSAEMPRSNAWVPIVPDSARFAEPIASPSARLVCAITEARPRQLRCFGRADSDGFYPSGISHNEAMPMFPAALGDIALAAIDGSSGCALDAKGTLRCWGANHRGQLGRGTHTPYEEPAPVTF